MTYLKSVYVVVIALLIQPQAASGIVWWMCRDDEEHASFELTIAQQNWERSWHVNHM